MIALSKFKSYLDLTNYFSNEKVCEEYLAQIRWKLNRVLLASKMKMPKETFTQKVVGKNNSFTKEERMKLRNVLIVLLNELDEVTNIDFSNAIKTVVEAKV